MSKIIINGKRSIGKINKNIFGHFSEHLGRCIYEGIAVKEDSKIPNIHGLRCDVIEALKEMSVPVLRYPGGCFADTYHWMDGVGKVENRKKIINTNWGGFSEDNSFGTHEAVELCSLIGADCYLSGNVGSGSVQEFSSWVEYCNCPSNSPMSQLRAKNGSVSPFNVKYWGIGNEAWGCGGNMRVEYYADLLRQYSTYLKDYSDFKIEKIASGASEDDYHWTEVLSQRALKYVDALSLHYYTRPLDDWFHKGSSIDYPIREYWSTLNKTLKIEEFINNHASIIARYDKEKRVKLAIDEWGTWYDVIEDTNPAFLYQQNTIRDALVAGINLNIFVNKADVISMANIAQIVNVLQSVILTEGDKMVLTPTYYVFEMYKGHQEAMEVESYASSSLVGDEDYKVPNLTVASSLKEDTLLITICNLALEANECDILLEGLNPIEVKRARTLTGSYLDYNSFTSPQVVKPLSLNTTIKDKVIHVKLEKNSVSAIEVKLG